MRPITTVFTCLLVAGGAFAGAHAKPIQDDAEGVPFLTYLTAGRVIQAGEDAGAVIDVLEEYNLGGAVLEVYRSGRVVPVPTLEKVRDALEAEGYAVAGGIATTPGDDFGVRQEAPLGWFNYEADKTQQDLAALMRNVAPVFDFFVVDDFLCTGDLSELSEEAKGDRSWPEYRRDLMVEIARDVIAAPAKEANPDITLCVKFPQWYDLFHKFGYDVERTPEQFDVVWVGTETRGRETQRFGFIQPYLGFVNYRWMRDMVEDKLTGAWFDHGDCDATDYVDQAYQTVLAGAPEIVLFNFSNIERGHEGDPALHAERARLETLSRAVDVSADTGVHCYKPPQSPAGGDLYLMDFLGMLGIPLLPKARFPEKARVLMLPAQAAADTDILEKVRTAHAKLDALCVTAGFLAAADEEQFCRWAGVAPVTPDPMTAQEIIVDGEAQPITHGLRIEAMLDVTRAQVVLEAVVDGKRVPFFTRFEADGVPVYVLNSHTYSEEDFRKVGEVLLAPAPMGLTELPRSWADTIRAACAYDGLPGMSAPASVTLQLVRGGEWFIQNYRDAATAVDIEAAGVAMKDGFDQAWASEGGRHTFILPARSRLWLTVD
ncbi:MAG: hypothetical protein ACLFTT_03655 [Candidatus Hydrogenedentota bacterium]